MDIVSIYGLAKSANGPGEVVAAVERRRAAARWVLRRVASHRSSISRVKRSLPGLPGIAGRVERLFRSVFGLSRQYSAASRTVKYGEVIVRLPVDWLPGHCGQSLVP